MKICIDCGARAVRANGKRCPACADIATVQRQKMYSKVVKSI